MRKFLLLFALVLLAAPSVAAQRGNLYSFDNFDVPGGVQVAAEPTVVRTGAAARDKKIRLTSYTASSASAVGKSRTDVVSASLDMRPRVSTGNAKSLEGFTTGNSAVDSLIVESASRNGVSPLFLYAIMHRESAFKAHAVSYKGARGLMQLMPATAARFGVRNIFDPQQNIEGGARYVAWLNDFFARRLSLDPNSVPIELILAGYNAGEGAVMKYGYAVPPYSETREYVRRISQRYALMRDPQAARRAPVATPAQVASLKKATNETTTPPVYEQNVFSVRLPNGQLMLVSQ